MGIGTVPVPAGAATSGPAEDRIDRTQRRRIVPGEEQALRDGMRRSKI
jgi:hypothetical protein